MQTLSKYKKSSRFLMLTNRVWEAILYDRKADVRVCYWQNGGETRQKVLSPVGTQNGNFLLIRIVVGLLDDIMPLLVRHIDKEDVTGFMSRNGILEFFWHHQLSEKPTGVAMGSIAIHGILV